MPSLILLIKKKSSLILIPLDVVVLTVKAVTWALVEYGESIYRRIGQLMW